MERAYRNLGYVLLALLPIFVAGFWIPYLSEFPRFDDSITLAVHIHAVLLFGFLALLIAQPILIRYRAYPAHRTLGKLANFLMPLILIFSVAMLWKEYHEHLASGTRISSARNDEFLSAAQLLMLAVTYGLSIAAIRRRDVGTHMRYMICIALIVLPAGLARTLGYWFQVRQSSSQMVCLALIDVLLLALIAFDGYRKVSPRVFIRIFLAYVAIEVLWISIGRPV